MTFLLAEPKRICFRALGTQTPRVLQESLRRGQLQGLFTARAPLPGRAAPGLGGSVHAKPCHLRTLSPVQLSFKNW